jgi:uncharacterized membrane protein
MEVFLVLLVLVGIFIVIPIFFFRAMFRAGGRAMGKAAGYTLETKAKTDALTTLNNRLANGEIDETEYQRLRAAIQ